MTYSDWAEALDDMERRLAAAERVLAGEDGAQPHPPLPEPLALTPVLGPLPQAQRARAEAIAAATRRLEEDLAAEMKAITEVLLSSPSLGGGVEPQPRFVDRRA